MEVKDRIALFIRKFGFQPKPHELCSRFEYCSVNKCPLYENFTKLISSPEDKEKKCKLNKEVRMEIALFFKLKNQGLTIRELNSMRKSIQMKKEFSLTRVKNLKTPENATYGLNSDIKGDDVNRCNGKE